MKYTKVLAKCVYILCLAPQTILASGGLIARALARTPGIKLTSPESCREIPTARDKRRINDMLIPRGGLFHECVTLTQSDGAPPQVDEALL